MRDETDRGFRDFSGNEQTIGSTVDDPAAVRVASPSGINKFSGNVLTPEGTQQEKQLIITGFDEDGNGCFDFFGQLAGRSDDGGMIRLARLSPRAFELFVPIAHSSQAPPPPAPPDSSDPTHSIPEGDFFRILEVYGFASDLQEAYGNARVTWVQVIQRQDERDDYRHFPKTAPPPVITSEERLQRVLDVEAARNEFAPMELDEGKVQSYLSGRSSLHEFHSDNVDRAGSHNPDTHRPGRPY